MHQPAFLKKGDKIAIVCTARKISSGEIEAAVAIFNAWGLEVVLGKNLFEINHQFAGTDEQRLADFQEMLNDSSIKAIVCARGGYGTARIIDRLDFSTFIHAPKWIVGYSDITVFHSHIHKNFNIETIHAIMPVNFSKDGSSDKAVESLKKALFGEPLFYQVNSISDLNRKGEAEGLLVGGNLSILYSLTGTVSQIETSNKILFLEDLDEYLYHIDRMMMNLKRCGMLSQLAGLIIGGMSDMKDNKVPYGTTAEEIIWENVKEYNYPVCFGFSAGHIKENLALYLGKRAKLTVSEGKISLSY